MIAELIRKTRSFRRFYQDEEIGRDTLMALVDLARMGGSARNVQPLKYLLVHTPEQCASIFPHLGWAGYFTRWPGPGEGERPAAYIVCLLDTRVSMEAECDLGIATQNILLGATAAGFGGCRIASFTPELKKVLSLDDHLKILLVLALGKPKETVAIEEIGPTGDIRYWRDESGVHHVPKRSLHEIVINEHP